LKNGQLKGAVQYIRNTLPSVIRKRYLLLAQGRGTLPPIKNSKKSPLDGASSAARALVARMKKLVPKISTVCWALLLIMALSIFLLHPSDISKLSAQDWLQALIFNAAIAGGVMLSILLSRRPLRIWAFMLAAVSLFLLWKQLVVPILIQMQAKGGGLTFPTAFAKWWSATNRNAFSSLTELPFTVFMLLSVISWPFYALLYGESDDSPPESQPQPLSNSLSQP
jgi:hypothetical protein